MITIEEYVDGLERRISELDEELHLARQGAEHLFQQAQETDANATIQFEARKVIENAYKAEREVSDKLEKELKSYVADSHEVDVGGGDAVVATCESRYLATTTLEEVAAIRKGDQP